MPRQKSLLTVIRELVEQEVRSAIQSLFGSVFTVTRAKNGRRRRKRRRGPGRPRGSKNKRPDRS
jgi:ribosomal protein L19E